MEGLESLRRSSPLSGPDVLLRLRTAIRAAAAHAAAAASGDAAAAAYAATNAANSADTTIAQLMLMHLFFFWRTHVNFSLA